LGVEVTNVSPHGFWLLIKDRERFVSFRAFPWFRAASIAELTNVELPSPHRLCWPDLDVDLAVDSLDHPDSYPLLSRAQPTKRSSAATAVVKERKAAYGGRDRQRR